MLPRIPILTAVLVLVLAVRPTLASAQLASFVSSSALYNPGRLYLLEDFYCGGDFFRFWTWETMKDPTHGRVNYVSKAEAVRWDLSYVSEEKFFMRADSTQIVPPSARGRDSVRITSDKVYGTSVVVLDLSHMPEGCATWPAFWSYSRAGKWPHGGEIDIIEGINLNTVNLESLHTTPNCTMDSVPRRQTGTTVSTNCDTAVNYNQGCGVNSGKPNSYGAPFNAAGGGWYAMERSPATGIRIWFWPRESHHADIPFDVRHDLGFVAPDTWGLPDSDFPTTECDYDSHFGDHQLIFDTTFCGDWAGAKYPDSGCPGNCTDFVDNNPDAFKNAYWEINALRVYTPAIPTISVNLTIHG